MPVPKKSEGFQGQRSIVLPRKIVTEFSNSHTIASGLYLTDIGYYPKAKYHYRQRTHGSDQHILIYCLDGKGKVQVQKNTYDLQPGSFIVIPAGAAHSYASAEEDSWTIYWIHFTGSLSKKWWRASNKRSMAFAAVWHSNKNGSICLMICMPAWSVGMGTTT